MSRCISLETVDRAKTGGLDWMYLTMPDGQLCIYVANDARIEWTKREAIHIVGGVLSAIMFGGQREGQGPPAQLAAPPPRSEH